MDQKKIGNLLRKLRKEKGVTQEELAEVMGVSNRTVSRWENGFNLPDIDLLIRIADYYDIELREVLDGERKCAEMNEDLKDTARKVADYGNYQKLRSLKALHYLLWAGFLAFTGYIILGHGDVEATSNIASALLGFSYGMLIMGVLYTSGCIAKLYNLKTRFSKERKDK